MWSKLFGGGPQHTTDSVSEIQSNLADGSAVMLDVRSQEEWDAGHLKDVLFIPFAEVKEISPGTQSVNGLPKDKIIYCH